MRANEWSAVVSVQDRRFYRYLVLGGSIGAAEAYIRGYWDSPDLTAALRLFARNLDVAQSMERGVTNLLKPLRVALNAFKRNTRRGSRKNISAHYDLSNDFFSLMLDRTMTYSSGIFNSESTELEDASIEKYDRICRKLQLTPSDRVLEIGSGWGGFAEHAAREYGCRVVTTTISNQQYEYAARRFQNAGLGKRISLLKQDYRDLAGQYDKIASIEMIESVGAEYLPKFFQKCSELLAPDGVMALQTITIPEYRYKSYRRSVDFIQRYIFPGGLLPSFGSMGRRPRIRDRSTHRVDRRFCPALCDHARGMASTLLAEYRVRQISGIRPELHQDLALLFVLLRGGLPRAANRGLADAAGEASISQYSTLRQVEVADAAPRIARRGGCQSRTQVRLRRLDYQSLGEGKSIPW